jgi:hypothetical protein
MINLDKNGSISINKINEIVPMPAFVQKYDFVVIICPSFKISKEWRDAVQDFLCRTTLSRRHSIVMQGGTNQGKQRKQSDCLIFIHSYYVN